MTDKKSPQIRSHCPNCGPGRYANVLYSHKVSGEDEESGIWEATKSYMLECGGCKTVFFHKEYMCSEDYGPDRPEKRITYYPAPAKRKRPDWLSLLDLERGLYSLLNETYNALDVDARVHPGATAMNSRRRVSGPPDICPEPIALPGVLEPVSRRDRRCLCPGVRPPPSRWLPRA
jgi:hypothetical protein